MNWANYHTHTNYCDGTDTPETYIKKAIELGFFALGFSGHAPFANDSTNWAIKSFQLQTYFDEIEALKEKYKSQIQIFKALEIDYLTQEMGVSDFEKYNLDYTIGSVHYIHKVSDTKYWGIDSSIENFEHGLKEYFNNDIKKVVKKYYALIREMIAFNPPDVIGHLDVIKKNNKADKFFSEKEAWYRNEVMHTIETIANSNCMVELNTRGLVTRRINALYPSNWILEELVLHKVPIVLNADAHKPEQLNGYFDKSMYLLPYLGIREVAVYYNNKWTKASVKPETGLVLQQ